MAKKIEWTRRSIQDRFEIYQFWVHHNKTDTYSKKLEVLFKAAALLVAEFPEVGTDTDFPGVKIKVVKNYKLFYISNPDVIQIVRVWDSRQDPKKLKIG